MSLCDTPQDENPPPPRAKISVSFVSRVSTVSFGCGKMNAVDAWGKPTSRSAAASALFRLNSAAPIFRARSENSPPNLGWERWTERIRPLGRPGRQKTRKRLFIVERTSSKPLKTKVKISSLMGTNSRTRSMLLILKANILSSFPKIKVVQNRWVRRIFRRKGEFVLSKKLPCKPIAYISGIRFAFPYRSQWLAGPARAFQSSTPLFLRTATGIPRPPWED